MIREKELLERFLLNRKATRYLRTRVRAEERVVRSEKIRADTETTRADTEKSRADAEKSRADAETTRAETEKTRADNVTRQRDDERAALLRRRSEERARVQAMEELIVKQVVLDVIDAVAGVTDRG